MSRSPRSLESDSVLLELDVTRTTDDVVGVNPSGRPMADSTDNVVEALEGEDVVCEKANGRPMDQSCVAS